MHLDKKVLLFLSVSGMIGSVAAQSEDKGSLSASFETNSIYYLKDDKTNAVVPDDNIGSNNYLKVDYTYKGFTTGFQVESYQPVIYGYPTELSGTKFVNYYAGWAKENFTVIAGSFYEQLGSGLLFRSWEDRALGLNNAMMGARFTYNFNDYVYLKALWGTPRLGMEYFDTQYRGADLSISVGKVLGWNKTSLFFEGSVLNKYDKLPADLIADGEKSNNNGYSGRINYEHSGFSFKAEYVDMGNKFINLPMTVDGEFVEWHKKNGNAQLVEIGYSGRGLGISMAGRRLEWMNTTIDRNSSSIANMTNYVPAMCTQYTYMLTTLHPYNPQTGLMTQNFLNSGEIGGQADIFYNVKRGTFLGGKRGMKLHANYSSYYTLQNEGEYKAGKMLFKDFSADIEKQWSRRFKSTILYSYQEYSPDYGMNNKTCLSNIVVADLLYKFSSKFSTRVELQYLTTEENEKDWVAGLIELNYAPKWSIYASDMYNNGDTKVHYYNFGASYSSSSLRASLSYGRVREGFVCSGGVCRRTPAYTGVNLNLVFLY